MIQTLHIVLAMKPLEVNFVQNALKYGVSGLNIDATRIETNEVLKAGAGGLLSNVRDHKEYPEEPGFVQNTSGRFPSNVILEKGCSVSIMDQQSGIRFSGKSNGEARVGESSNGVVPMMRRGKLVSRDDIGGASRFFKQICGI